MPKNDISRVRQVLNGHPEVMLAILFGSLATGRANSNSDVDIAIAAERPLTVQDRLRLIEDLAVATGRPVDLVDLAVVGEPLLGEILHEGKRLLGSDERYARLLTKHLVEAADFLPYRRRILAERRKAWMTK